MPRVSIIVPVYNAETYLKACIDSLLSQTLAGIEIVLVDDGSLDQSGAICDEYEAKDKRVLVIHQENQGVSVARNAGLDKATGEWITFVDSDDLADAHMCEISLKAAEEAQTDILVFSYYSVYANKTVHSKLIDLPAGDVTRHKELIIKKTISQYFGGNVANNGVSAGTTWGKLIRKSIIENNKLRFVRGMTRAQDTVFWMNCFECAEHIALIDAPLYFYRITDTSICSGTKYLPNCEIPFGMLLKEYAGFIQIHNKEAEYQEALDIRIMQVMMWHLRHKVFHKSNPMGFFERINQFRGLAQKAPFKQSIARVNIQWLPRGLKLLTIFCRIRMYGIYWIVFMLIQKFSNRTRMR